MEKNFDNEFINIRIPETNIMCKGYGNIARNIMRDDDITPVGKALYMYFVSLSAGVKPVFPTRKTLLSDMDISKDFYYKGLNELENKKLIYIRRSKDEKTHKYNVNTYYLNLNAQCKQTGETPSKSGTEFIGVNDIYSGGMGMLPFLVMQCRELTYIDKCVYGYIVSFTGGGTAKLPLRTTILKELNISEKSYKRSVGKLIKMNLIVKGKKQKTGQMTYLLNSTPAYLHNGKLEFDKKDNAEAAITETPSGSEAGHGEQHRGLRQDTENTVGVSNRTREKEDRGLKQDTENSIGVSNGTREKYHRGLKQDMETEPSGSEAGHRTIDINNILYSLTHSKERERETKSVSKSIKEYLLKEKKLPYFFAADEEKMTEAIHVMTDWELLKNGGYATNDELRQKVYNLFNTALIDMCLPKEKKLTFKGKKISYNKVIDKINDMAVFKNDYIDISEFSEAAINNYYDTIIKQDISSPLNYMKACIWDALNTENIKLYAALKRNELLYAEMEEMEQES